MKPRHLPIRRGRPVKDKIEPQPRYRTKDGALRAMTDEERGARVRLPTISILSNHEADK